MAQHQRWDRIWIGAGVATMVPGGAPYGAIADGAVAVADGRIAWVGRRAELPGDASALAGEVHEHPDAWILPGLIDCHTHLVHAGDRAAEFELGLQGATYEEIARAGGGIRATVAATRAASEDALFEAAAERARALIAEGVTTIEIKSGYGLNVEDELKQLRVARRLGRELPVTVRTTLLAAHAVAPEYDGDPDGYITLVCDRIVPAAAKAGLADAVDAFCDTIGFTPAQTERVFEAAARHYLPVKLHAEQLSDQGGAALAARHRALSCDHLEYVSDFGVAAMAAAGTIAVLLPAAFYFLRETRLPPIDAFRRHRVPMAVATDTNPGSAPVGSLLLMLNMACTLFRLTPEEALAGVTREAARALGLHATHGTLEPGKAADLALFRIARPAELAYRFGCSPCIGTVKDGRPVAGPAR